MEPPAFGGTCEIGCPSVFIRYIFVFVVVKANPASGQSIMKPLKKSCDLNKKLIVLRSLQKIKQRLFSIKVYSSLIKMPQFIKYCLMVSLIIFVVGNHVSLLKAEDEAKNNLDLTEEPCYVEDFIQVLAKDPKFPPISSDVLALLPYFIYADKFFNKTNREFYTTLNMAQCLQRVNHISDNVSDDTWFYPTIFKNQFDAANNMEKEMREQAFNSYEVSYANMLRPPIDKADLTVYEERAKQGDLTAMYELKRYYDYPDEDYNPEKTESRFWLFKAIEVGDELSMLEAGYDRPYSVRSELSYNGINIAIDVVCEGIDKSGPTPFPACFLYNLLIGDHSGQIGHLIIDQDYFTGFSIRPRILALLVIDDNVLLELSSFSDKSQERIRRDYFNLEGQYLGSNRPEFTPDFFWNYRGLLPTAKSELQLINVASDAQQISLINVQTLPYVESYLFWETEFPKENRIIGIDDMISIEEDWKNLIMGNASDTCVWDRKKFNDLYDGEQALFSRLNKLVKLDPYKEIRISSRELKFLSPLETGYFKINYKSLMGLNSYPCMYFPPRSSPYQFMCNPSQAFQAYEALMHRPTYIVELGSDIKAVRMLQVCRYTEHYSMDRDIQDNPFPCYAIQLRVKTKDGYKYHYVINMLPKTLGTQSNTMVALSTIYYAKAELIDSKNYFIFSSVLKNYTRLNMTDALRVDIFDEKFTYLGSSNPALSKAMIPGFKRLPDEFIKQLDHWLYNPLKTIQSGADSIMIHDNYIPYPECGDIIVEQRRKAKHNNH
jgi:hypothetical protein